jgi:hypothetical protein
MSSFSDPQLFSKVHSVDPNLFDLEGLIDPYINVDLPLFIDPLLLGTSQNDIVSSQALPAFRSHFDDFIRLMLVSEAEDDPAWRAAKRLLNLQEPPENGLGYGSASRSGSSRPETIRLSIMRTTKAIVKLGSKDPDMISLMSFLEDGVGPDTISDFTSRVIKEQLARITYEFCKKATIPTYSNPVSSKYELPMLTSANGKRRYFVFIPKDIVRDLPIANDWSALQAAIEASQSIKEDVNRMLGSMAQVTVSDRKNVLRGVVLKSQTNFDEFLLALKNTADSYDTNIDALSYYKLRDILTNGFGNLKSNIGFDFESDNNAILKVVQETLEVFKHHVEHGNLWEELWIGNQPKKERAAQLIYFAIADCFCKANNIDISPEANMGGGPVDFKFSSGYSSRVLVEMKRSTGNVVNGYTKKLEFYKNASQTETAIFVIIDYGKLDNKLDVILAKQREIRQSGRRASEIVIIDASQKKSASKRA